MSEIVCSPLTGMVVRITEVNDEMFAQKMLGDGVAIIPNGREVRSPIDGEVVMVYETKHAIGLKTQGGVELLIHIGIDTVELAGKPFDTKVSTGDKVMIGDTLTIVDWEYIKSEGKDTIVPMIALQRSIRVLQESGNVEFSDPLFEIQ